jgi:3-oxo-5-alpha-steroid 4-dehydrogenase 1
MGNGVFQIVVYLWIGFAVLLAPILLKVTAPYGRHTARGWGPTVAVRTGWIIMEWPVLLVFSLFFFGGSNRHGVVSWIFLALWMLHYVNRSLVYPFRMRSQGKTIPAVLVFSGVFYNFMNASLVGHYLGSVSAPYAVSWLVDPRFIVGAILFLFGLTINWWSDSILLSLRKPGEGGYKIPYGGPFRFLSCPNHFGEIVEWCGFALMLWALPALAFAIWTVTNLLPRALDHHKWYREQFPDYPRDRKAILPFAL